MKIDFKKLEKYSVAFRYLVDLGLKNIIPKHQNQ